MRHLWLLIWVVLSVIWFVGGGVLLPPVGSQLNYVGFVLYLLGGSVITAALLWLLYRIEPNFFSSLSKAAPVGAVFLAIFALFGFLISAEREARRPFLEKQLATCSDIAGIVGTLATATAVDENSWKYAAAKFWSYYWGRLGMFEDISLERRMVQFGNMLIGVENIRGGKGFTDPQSANARSYLQYPALCVAHTCRAQAQVAWSVVPGLIRDPDAKPSQYCGSADNACQKFLVEKSMCGVKPEPHRSLADNRDFSGL
jgi:hypothetical protein